MRYHIYDADLVTLPVVIDDENDTWIDYRNYNGNAYDTYEKNILIKDLIDSDKFLKLVLKYHNKNKNKLYHIFYNPDADYIITDCVINYKLDAKGKMDLAKKATEYYLKHWNTNETVIVNFLTPNGHLSPVIPTSMENYALCEMMYNDKTLPLHNYIYDYKQLDFCLSQNTRNIKEPNSIWTHNANIIVVNDLNEGNSIYKALAMYQNMLGYVIGADVDVVLNSRSHLYMNDMSADLLEKKEYLS
jgi:phosphotransacetylase